MHASLAYKACKYIIFVINLHLRFRIFRFDFDLMKKSEQKIFDGVEIA